MNGQKRESESPLLLCGVGPVPGPRPPTMSASPPLGAVPCSHIMLPASGDMTRRANVLSGSLQQQREDPLSLACLTVVFTICREGPTCYASSPLIFTLSRRL